MERDQGRFSLPRDFIDILRPPIRPLITAAPRIEAFEPVRGPAGSEVIVRGRNLRGARFFIGEAAARAVAADKSQARVIVPRITGRHEIRAANAFGTTRTRLRFQVTDVPDVSGAGFTFRGDANFAGHSILSSIVPSALNQRYLALIVLPSDLDLPTGMSEADLVAIVDARMNGASDSANSFWLEASYGKTSLIADVHPKVLDLPNKLEDYFRYSEPKRIDADGASYPITWSGGETLSLAGKDDFEVTVTFEAGVQAIDQVIQAITDAIEAIADADSGPQIIASENAGQLRLESAEEEDDAVLDILGGSAVEVLGLGEGTTTIVAGKSGRDDDDQFIVDALEARVAAMSDEDAKAYLSQYSGCVVAVASETGWDTLRASANTNVFNVRGEQYELCWVDITTAYGWQTYAHEVGHNLGFPDLYDEPKGQELLGEEVWEWDIMSAANDAHPSSWIKSFKTYKADEVDKTWMPPSEILPLDPPPGSGQRSIEALLIPIEVPFPGVNPFAGSHPDTPICHAIQIKLADDRSIYVENRQRGPFNDADLGSASYSNSLPAAGVIVTDAVNTMDGLPVFRQWVVLATPYYDPLDAVNEEATVLQLTPTNSIKVKVMESVGTNPAVYRVQVTWGQGSYFDYRIRDWSPPPWESKDIWIDTRVDNGWDEYLHDSAASNPDVAGNPVRNGDRVKVGSLARVYARVWNDGDIDRSDVTVKFQIVVPAGMGPVSGFDIGADTIDLPAGGFGLAKIEWTPRDDNEGHVCVRAFVVADPDELNANNNLAQENITDWYLEGASPLEPVEFTFQVMNPLPRKALVWLRARGLKPGWYLDVEPVRFWLRPGERVEGKARLRADDRVPYEDKLKEKREEPPVISLEALVKQGDTYAPFGGISGTAHAVRRARITLDVKVESDGVLIATGRATTNEGPIAGGTVSFRLLARDARTELEVVRTSTDRRGFYTGLLRAPVGVGLNDQFFVEALLAPSAGIGPAVSDLRPTSFKL